jgi:hypothetical protein
MEVYSKWADNNPLTESRSRDWAAIPSFSTSHFRCDLYTTWLVDFVGDTRDEGGSSDTIASQGVILFEKQVSTKSEALQKIELLESEISAIQKQYHIEKRVKSRKQRKGSRVPRPFVRKFFVAPRDD